MRNKFAKVSDPNSFVTDPGSRYHVIFEPKVNPDGTIALIEAGKEDIQEYLDSQLPLTDISYIIRKIEEGDTSVLNPGIPSYGDFTNVPKSYAEAIQLVINAERDFYTLDPDVRNKFDNDYRQWLAQAGTDDWIKKMNIVTEGPIDQIVEEENEGEIE